MKTDKAIAYLKGPVPDAPGLSTSVKEEDAPVITSCFENLSICYIVDSGDSYSYVQNRHLIEEGITCDELHQIGLRNLLRLIGRRNSKVERHGNLFAFLAGGDFEASAILLPNLWDKSFREYVSGEYACVVPARDVLAFCDATSERGIAELHGVINRVWATGDHLVSKNVFVRHSSEWRTIKP